MRSPKVVPLRRSLFPGLDHPVLEHLARRGLPATEPNYLLFSFPDGVPEPLGAKDRADMEEALEQAGR